MTHLLRHTYREDGKVKHRTVGNLSDLPNDLIEVIRKRLAGQPLPTENDEFEIVRSLPHGHVTAVLGTLRKIGLDRIYYTGRQSNLVKMGYSRDGKPGNPQIVYGLLCAPDGCPVLIEVFSGNTGDPTTFTAQVNTIRKRFGITRIVLVSDRGMITSKRIDEDLRGALSELLFDDHQREQAEATRESIVSPAPRSEAAKRKEQERRTEDGFPVQSFQCLLKDLATLCKNRVRWSSRAEGDCGGGNRRHDLPLSGGSDVENPADLRFSSGVSADHVLAQQ